MNGFMEKKYSIIYADPPWSYTNSIGCKNGKTHVTNHYATMKIEDICNLSCKIDKIVDKNCLLFMWTTGPTLPWSLLVAEKWGFQYATVAFVWDKSRVNMGFYTMSSCEFVIVFKKGKIPTPRGSRNTRQFLSENATIHSRKPHEIRNRINEMFPTQNKIELFARSKHDGWDAWGDQIDTDIIL